MVMKAGCFEGKMAKEEEGGGLMELVLLLYPTDKGRNRPLLITPVVSVECEQSQAIRRLYRCVRSDVFPLMARTWNTFFLRFLLPRKRRRLVQRSIVRKARETNRRGGNWL